MERYIFLDFDGVMNTRRSYRQYTANGGFWHDDLGPFFDPEAVANLKYLIDTTEAGVVITSSWKYKGLDAMHSLWALRQMPGFLLDITPEVTDGFYSIRGAEVAKWLATAPMVPPEEYRYVIIDDSSDYLPEQMPLLINTDPEVGLTRHDACSAIDILMA